MDRGLMYVLNFRTNLFLEDDHSSFAKKDRASELIYISHEK